MESINFVYLFRTNFNTVLELFLTLSYCSPFSNFVDFMLCDIDITYNIKINWKIIPKKRQNNTHTHRKKSYKKFFEMKLGLTVHIINGLC